MAELTVKVLSKEEELAAENAKLRAKFYSMQAQIDRLNSENSSMLQGKVSRQAKALTGLNKRVRVQRLILRELNEHHTDLANDLYHSVMDKYATELDDDITLVL